MSVAQAGKYVPPALAMETRGSMPENHFHHTTDEGGNNQLILNVGDHGMSESDDDLAWHVEEDDPDYDYTSCDEMLSSDNDWGDEGAQTSSEEEGALVIDESSRQIHPDDGASRKTTIEAHRNNQSQLVFDRKVVNLNGKSDQSVTFVGKEIFDFGKQEPTPIKSPWQECELCTKKFISTISLTTHLSWHNQRPKKMYDCPLCPYQCFTYSRLQLHSRWHSITKKFQCLFCHAFFQKEKNCLDHEELHLTKKAPCKLCKKIFPNNLALHVHYHNDHRVDNQNSCDRCEYKTTLLTSLENHIDEHDCALRDFEIYKCHYCDFTHKKFLHKHIRKMHGNVKDFQCDVCSQTLQTELLLYKHTVRLHIKSNFYCELCSRYFMTSDRLNGHFNTVYHKVTAAAKQNSEIQALN